MYQRTYQLGSAFDELLDAARDLKVAKKTGGLFSFPDLDATKFKVVQIKGFKQDAEALKEKLGRLIGMDYFRGGGEFLLFLRQFC